MTQAYLGDGLYATYDGYIIWLKTQRETYEHYVALEPEVFDELIKFACEIGWLKKGQVIK